MCEVLRSNFEDLLPIIEKHIKSADLIALDTEFTGLKLSEDQPSLFDSGEQRYHKLKKSVSQFSISQIGISAFQRNHNDENQYCAFSYNFFLFPSSFGPVDVRFCVQASSYEFLSKHNFDFNKYVKEGVSFLNEVQETKLRKYLQKLEHIKGLERDVDEKALQEYCSKVAVWVTKAEIKDQLMLDTTTDVPDLVIIAEVKHRFKNVWVKEDGGQIVVEKVTEEERKKIDLDFREHEEESILNRALGFSRVFKCLMQAQKPILGHNNFTDIMLMYDKFYKPLPDKYSSFKTDVLEMFPKVFDTKHLALNLRRPLEDSGLFEYTSLGELYHMLDSDKGRQHALHSPSIIHGDGCHRYKVSHHAHEAGYDAYMCGYVFLRIAHILATQGIKSSDVRPMTLHDYMDSMRPYTNCVNMIRASVSHVKFDDQDPLSQRPQWLIVRGRKLQQHLQSAELAQLFSQYGSVDIQLQNNKQALVAVSNHRCSKEILKAFRKHPSLRIVTYRPWKHSLVVRNVMWGGVLVFGSLSVWTLWSGFRGAQSGS